MQISNITVTYTSSMWGISHPCVLPLSDELKQSIKEEIKRELMKADPKFWKDKLLEQKEDSNENQ